MKELIADTAKVTPYESLRALAVKLDEARARGEKMEAGKICLSVQISLGDDEFFELEVFDPGDFFQAFLELTKPKGEIDKLTPEEIAEGDRVGTELANKARREQFQRFLDWGRDNTHCTVGDIADLLKEGLIYKRDRGDGVAYGLTAKGEMSAKLLQTTASEDHPATEVPFK